MATRAQLKAQAKYDRNHTRAILCKFNLGTDADILQRLDASGNMQGYIKSLIRKDIRGTGEILSIDAIRILLLPVVKRFQIRQIYLFGSYARGDANAGSDIDLLIVGGNAKGMLSFVELQEMMEKRLGKEVDLAEYDAVKKDQTRAGRRFLEQIERDKVLLYD